MLRQVTAVNFLDRVANGRTRPIRLEALTENDDYVELVGKFSGGCDRGVTSLAVETLCAALAVDLDLPIPEPFIVEIDPDFIADITDTEIREILHKSCHFGFGSKQLPPGYFTWARNSQVHETALATALSVYVFDCFTQNIDRRPDIPNCLTNGRNLGIFDHEIALNVSGVLFWKPPWVPGGLDAFAGTDKHIFFNSLKAYSGKYAELEKIEARWQNLSVERIASYAGAIPGEWFRNNEVQEMLQYLLDVKSNLQQSFTEIRQILL